MDGEEPGVAAEELRAHVDGCDACAQWQARAARIDRMMRIAPAPASAPSEVSERVLAGVRLPRRSRWWKGVRAALGAVAAVQLVVALAHFAVPLGLPMGFSSGPHMSHESAAFNLAFGVALLATALDTRRARAYLPILGSFTVVLVTVSVFDLTAGTVGWTRLATHVPIILGLVLTAALARRREHPPSPESEGIRPVQSVPGNGDPDATEAGVALDGSPPPVAHDREQPYRRSA